MLLHDHSDFDDLLAVVAREQGIDPGLVEKDYWNMHALWGLQQSGFSFELKGGTSLSKGHGLIHRFSEDIDILIHPDGESLPTGRNQNKPAHIKARRACGRESTALVFAGAVAPRSAKEKAGPRTSPEKFGRGCLKGASIIAVRHCVCKCEISMAACIL